MTNKRNLTAVFNEYDAQLVIFAAKKCDMSVSELINVVVMHDIRERWNVEQQYKDYQTKLMNDKNIQQ